MPCSAETSLATSGEAVVHSAAQTRQLMRQTLAMTQKQVGAGDPVAIILVLLELI